MQTQHPPLDEKHNQQPSGTPGNNSIVPAEDINLHQQQPDDRKSESERSNEDIEEELRNHQATTERD